MILNATLNRLIKMGAACALAVSSYASATTILTNEYTLTATTTNISGNQWQFDYSVTNNNQTVGGKTGFDGLTIFIPDAANIVSYVVPASYSGKPGYWDTRTADTGLALGGNGSQNVAAPSGFYAFTWWGQDPTSVYPVGKTANFSIILDNVGVGTNTVALSSYFGFTHPTSEHATNAYGNYSVYLTNALTPDVLRNVVVPEPNLLGLLLAGLGMIGLAQLRRKNG